MNKRIAEKMHGRTQGGAIKWLALTRATFHVRYHRDQLGRAARRLGRQAFPTHVLTIACGVGSDEIDTFTTKLRELTTAQAMAWRWGL